MVHTDIKLRQNLYIKGAAVADFGLGMKRDIKNFTLDELTAELAGMEKERFRAKQIFKWIFKKDAQRFDQMTDLTVELREQLDRKYFIQRFKQVDEQISEDGTRKHCWKLSDGELVETVLIPGENGRTTLCISSQIGCALRCRFCRTGSGGFVRDMTAGEITEQILAANRTLTKKDRRISNIVIMGMGEPLLNYDNTLRTIRLLFTDDGLNYSARKVTISTAGISPMIERLGQEIEISLAISLHAVDDEKRSRIMPINKKYPISTIIEACKNYPLGTRRRITFEYLLMGGFNDSDAEAAKLAKLIAPVKSKVNLIVFNPFEGCEFIAPTPERVVAFQDVLAEKRVSSIVRKSRGSDILAACGQLRARQ